MPKRRTIVALCLCLILFVAAAAQAATRQNPYEKAVTVARSQIWQAINSGKCGSATVAISVDGKFVYAEGFGMADREKSTPVDASTLFNIGSISKVYVAAAIMILVDDGKVSLDKPVTYYLPQFRMADSRYKAITVRMLLNHTSGLPGTEYANSFGFKYNDKLKQETIETLTRSHLKHAPGAMAVYCNDGFTLAEMIVERTAGMTYLDFLNRRVFKPLHLKNTGVSIGEIKGKTVAAYYESATGKKHPPEALSVLGAGGLSATAVDLCRFADAFSAENKLLKKASLAEMRKAQPSTFSGKLRNPSLSFGLGWDLTGLPRYDAAGIRVLGKSGGTGNFSSMVYTVPDKRISVAVITAGTQSGTMQIALDILDAVLIEKKLMAKEEKGVKIPPAKALLPSEDLPYGGYYAGQGGLAQAVFAADRKSVTIYGFNGPEKRPVATLIYAYGTYHDDKGSDFYFASVGPETYLVQTMPSLAVDTIAMQKVKPLPKPQNLRIDMDGKVWLRRNIAPFESVISVESHLEKSFLYKELPGYVVFRGVKRIESPEYAAMPFDSVRDQSELFIFERNGAMWAWISDMLYSPAESAASALKAGELSVKIGSDGYTEWLLTTEDLILAFTRPKQGRVIVFNADDTVAYDSAIDSGEAYAAKGSYIEVAGYSGDLFTVKARTAAAARK